MVIASFIPHIIAIYTISVSIYAKCINHLLFLIGLVISHESAKIMKKMLKQPRPTGAFLSSYGMPSDHSMFMFFITSYVILFLRSNPRLRRSSFAISAVSLIVTSCLVCFSRLYLGVHSVDQVSVGAGIGILLGCFWYLLVNKYLSSSKLLSRAFHSIHERIHDLFLGTITPIRK